MWLMPLCLPTRRGLWGPYLFTPLPASLSPGACPSRCPAQGPACVLAAEFSGGPWGQACEGHIPFAGAVKVAEQLTVGWETTWVGLTWPHSPLLLRGRGHVEGATRAPR